LQHLSRAEFQRYWRGTHGPLVARHAGVLGIKRYVQTHTLDHAANAMLAESRGAPEEFDGVAELWWTSAEDLAAATNTPEGRAALHPPSALAHLAGGGASDPGGVMNAPVRLIVTSDYLCPWCYVAAVRLRRLQEEFGERLALVWQSFLLRPYPDRSRTLEQF